MGYILNTGVLTVFFQMALQVAQSIEAPRSGTYVVIIRCLDTGDNDWSLFLFGGGDDKDRYLAVHNNI